MLMRFLTFLIVLSVILIPGCAGPNRSAASNQAPDVTAASLTIIPETLDGPAGQNLATAFAEAAVPANDVVPDAQNAFDAARRVYREGKSDYLMVLDAQRTFFYPRARYIESLAAYYSARADVERLIG